MTSIFARELLVMTRRAAFSVAACTLVVTAAAFAAIWPRGVPLHAGSALFPQLVLAQQLAIAIVAPWVVCRCGARERGNDLVLLSLFSALRPSRIVVTRFAASVVALLILSLGSWPVLVYAQQAAAITPVSLVAVALDTTAVVAVAAAWALIFEQSIRSGVTTWLASAVTTVSLILVAMTNGHAGGIVIAGVGVSLACLLAVAARADMTARYLVEESV